MSTRMIVEFPDGQQILFGGTGSGTGLSEVGVEEEITKRTEAAFKSGIGAIGKLVPLHKDYDSFVGCALMLAGSG